MGNIIIPHMFISKNVGTSKRCGCILKYFLKTLQSKLPMINKIPLVDGTFMDASSYYCYILECKANKKYSSEICLDQHLQKFIFLLRIQKIEFFT